MRTTHYTQHCFWLDPLLILSLIAVVSVILSRNALQVFEFFDMSAFIDAGYRSMASFQRIITRSGVGETLPYSVTVALGPVGKSQIKNS